MIRVFYDGSCGLCSKEIAYYMKRAPSGRFEWIDLSKTPAQFTQLGYSLTDGFRLMHVQNHQGNMKIATDAFILIWRELGGAWKILATIVACPIIHSLATFAYKIFAKRRFKKSQQACQLSSSVK